MSRPLRQSEFLDGIALGLRARLDAPWSAFQVRRQAHLLKIWFHEPSIHYEVWPIAGRDMIEVGLHFESTAAVNMHLLDVFDPRIFELKAAVDGAVDLEQWTATWACLHTVVHASRLDPAVQQEVVDWLANIVPVAEPIVTDALAVLGPLQPTTRQPRDWSAWRKRQTQRQRQPHQGRR